MQCQTIFYCIHNTRTHNSLSCHFVSLYTFFILYLLLIDSLYSWYSHSLTSPHLRSASIEFDTLQHQLSILYFHISKALQLFLCKNFKYFITFLWFWNIRYNLYCIHSLMCTSPSDICAYDTLISVAACELWDRKSWVS